MIFCVNASERSYRKFPSYHNLFPSHALPPNAVLGYYDCSTLLLFRKEINCYLPTFVSAESMRLKVAGPKTIRRRLSSGESDELGVKYHDDLKKSDCVDLGHLQENTNISSSVEERDDTIFSTGIYSPNILTRLTTGINMWEDLMKGSFVGDPKIIVIYMSL